MTWFRCGIKNNEYKVLDSIIDHTITSFKANYTTIKQQLLSGCNLLTDVDLPEVTSISAYGFALCSSLTIIDFPKLTNIASNAFTYCTSLETIILRSDTMCTLEATSGFYDSKFWKTTGNGGKLYVPQSLITSYENDSVWSTLLGRNANNQVLAIEGSPYEEV